MPRIKDMSFKEKQSFSEPEPNNDRIFPLDSATLLLAELALGEDLKNVRIHTGSRADRMTRQAGADALASGENIYFRDGMFQSQTEEGKNLLIHELQHVIQHEKGQIPLFGEDRAELEYEAYKKEALIAQTGLHSLEAEGLERDSSSSELEDYGKKQKDFIRIIGKSGKIYMISKEDRISLIQDITSKVEEKIGEEWNYWEDDKKENLLKKLSANGGGQL
jgi:hypothetical protein